MTRQLTAIIGVVCLIALGGCLGLDFSPDGKSVAVTTSAGIAIMPVGGGARNLIPDSKDGALPLWSPDGKWILYWRASGESEDVYLYDAVNRRSRKMGDKWQWPYAWREDSKRFAAVQKDESGSKEIVWYDLAEGGVAQAVHVQSGVGPMIWIPDTDNLAFLGGGSGKDDVYLAEAGDVKRISTTGDVIGLALSASRKELIWARRGANLKHQLLSVYKFKLKERSVERLPFPMRIPLINPDSRRAPESLGFAAISPDSRRIAVIAVYTEKAQGKIQKHSACFSIALDGSDARLVRKSPPRSGSAGVLFPVWSRDGSRLGVYDLREKELSVAVFDSRGVNGQRILTEKTK